METENGKFKKRVKRIRDDIERASLHDYETIELKLSPMLYGRYMKVSSKSAVERHIGHTDVCCVYRSDTMSESMTCSLHNIAKVIQLYRLFRMVNKVNKKHRKRAG